MIFDANIKIRE